MDNINNKTKLNYFLKLLKENWQPALAVTMINLPLSIALAVASLGTGSSVIPMMGIITAVFGGVAASIFSSNKYNIYGPAGAIAVVLIAFLAVMDGDILMVPVLTITTSLIIFAIQKLKLSKYIMLIPASALSGFLMGVGLIIIFSQLNDALGIIPAVEKDGAISKILQTLSQINEINFSTFLIFLTTFLFLFFYKFSKISKKIPGAVIVSIGGIIFGYVVSVFFNDSFLNSVETLKSSFSGVRFSFIDLSYISESVFNKIKNPDTLITIIKFAFSVAIIALLETLITSKAISKKTKTKFNKNKEVFGLGMSNLFSGLAGGMPSTAVIVRTIFNVESGANSKVAGFLGAIMVLLISFLFFDYFSYIPMPVIAAILVNISIGLIDLKELSRYRKMDKISYVLALIVALVTFIEDPIAGIVFGTVAALLFFIKDVSTGKLNVSIFKDTHFVEKISLKKYLKKQHKGFDTIILKFPIAINYINAESFIEQIEKIDKPKNIIFSFAQVAIVDIDGIELLDEVYENLKDKKINIYFTGIISERLKEILYDKQYFQELSGKDMVYDSSAYVIEKIKNNF